MLRPVDRCFLHFRFYARTLWINAPKTRPPHALQAENMPPGRNETLEPLSRMDQTAQIFRRQQQKGSLAAVEVVVVAVVGVMDVVVVVVVMVAFTVLAGLVVVLVLVVLRLLLLGKALIKAETSTTRRSLRTCLSLQPLPPPLAVPRRNTGGLRRREKARGRPLGSERRRKR